MPCTIMIVDIEVILRHRCRCISVATSCHTESQPCRANLFQCQVGGRQGHQVDLTAQLQGGLGDTRPTVEGGVQNQDL